MQAVTATLQQQTVRHQLEWSQLLTAPVSWMTRIFGCWHQEMSRPFTLHAESYRVCLECGAHRQFNPQTWEMTGPYYYEPSATTQGLYQPASASAVKTAPARRQPQSVFRLAA